MDIREAMMAPSVINQQKFKIDLEREELWQGIYGCCPDDISDR